MGVSGNSINGKSFQSFTVSDDLLQKITEAVQAGEKKARSSGNMQSFEVFYRGFRQNIAIGRIYIIPASICSDRKNFPTALLYGCLVREFGGEELGDLIDKKIGESEFDEYSQADFDTIKEKLFYDSNEEEFKSVVLFAPMWWNQREYITFKFTTDVDQLKNNIRHQIFSAYYDPALSSSFDAMMTNVNTSKLDVTDITPKLNFPFLATGLKEFPNLEKRASKMKPKIFLSRHTADAITKEVLDPQELDVFDSLSQALGDAIMPTETVEEAAEPSEGFAAADSFPRVPKSASKTAANGVKTRSCNHGYDASCEKCAHLTHGADGRSLNASVAKTAYVAHVPGHKDSKGESAPWVIKQHDSGKILESFHSEEDADAGLRNMEAHKHGANNKHEAPIKYDHTCKEKDGKCIFCGSTMKKTSSVLAKLAGKYIKTANIKVTFGTDKVYFDMNGNKYMLTGDAANQFIEEWLPQFHALKDRAEQERNALVEKLAQKYMAQMEKRTEKAKQVVPEKAMAQTASVMCPKCDTSMKKEDGKYVCPSCSHKMGAKQADWNSFTPDKKKDNVHPGTLKDADVIAAIDEKKWGTATIPLNFGKRQGGVPSVKSAGSKRPDFSSLDAFTQSYIEAMLWTEEEQINQDMGHRDWGQESISPESAQQIIGVCRNFQHDAAPLLEEAYGRPGYNEGRAGHDFWLTRNGHGAGFWDHNELEEGDLGDKLSEVAKKYGESNLYVGDDGSLHLYESEETTPQHELNFHASYIASKLGKIVDFEHYDAASSKTKKARVEQEAKLAKNRQKQADVALDIDSIWAEMTEDFGPAPVADVPMPPEHNTGAGGESSESESKSDTWEKPWEKKEEESSEPKSDDTKNIKSDKPFREFIDKKNKKETEEGTRPEESKEASEKWQISAKLADFVGEAWNDMTDPEANPDDEFFEDDSNVPHCDQCEMLNINGMNTHETGCPNSKKTWDGDRGSWVRYVECMECGQDVEEGEPHECIADDLYNHEASKRGCKEFNEAKTEVVSPDTVDPDIKQETKSVAEAAKVGKVTSTNSSKDKCADCGVAPGKEHKKNRNGGMHSLKEKKADAVQPDISEAKSEVVSPDTVDKDIHQETKSVEEAAKVGAHSPDDFSGLVGGQPPERSLEDQLPEFYQTPEQKGLGNQKVVPRKRADAVQPDISQAKSEVVNPDTVDKGIHQETKSVEEAAKIGADSSHPGWLSGNNTESCDCKDCPQCGADQMVCAKCNQCSRCSEEPHTSGCEGCSGNPDHRAWTNPTVESGCPKCGNNDTEEMETADGKYVYCHGCEQTSKTASEKCGVCGEEITKDPYRANGMRLCSKTCFDIAKDPKKLENSKKTSAAGDEFPEEVNIDFGAGDLADIVGYENEKDDTE